MPPNAPLDPTGVSAVYEAEMKGYSVGERRAAARAILRYRSHSSAVGHLKTQNINGLHQTYVELHDRGSVRGDVEALIMDCQNDLFDAVTSLDRMDGGISLVLRCPGFDPGSKSGAECITVDVHVSPRELEHDTGGKELTKALALMVQAFGSDVALPYLQRYVRRCAEEGIVPRKAPAAGRALKASGRSHLPGAETCGSHFRCRCRRGTSCDFMQDIFMEERGLPVSKSMSSTSNGPGVAHSDWWVERKEVHSEMNGAPRHEPVDDGYGGVIVSLGPRTDAVLTRNSSWEALLQVGEFNLSYEQARNLVKAMHGDFGIRYKNEVRTPF
ncbi:hypothetical protein DXG01_014839 [Tephrocybe rancida]|nr:hypothetical protein DXG01_014839 [Tephrocybe rancida]